MTHRPASPRAGTGVGPTANRREPTSARWRRSPGGLGCSLVVLAFSCWSARWFFCLLSSSAASGRYPVMPLIAGILFSGVGLWG